jgi:phosphatidylinositol kinase/protein kinase (PI-3  family)
MKEMNHIFKEENIDAEIVLYEVLPVDKTEGLIECVENARAFLEFKKTADENDSKSADVLKKFIEQKPERQTNLFRTFLGFVISGIVLQLADRHGTIFYLLI